MQQKPDATRRTIAAARERTGKLTIILLKAIFGCGYPIRADRHGAHGAPFGRKGGRGQQAARLEVQDFEVPSRQLRLIPFRWTTGLAFPSSSKPSAS